jgi:hypothetical protein
VQREERNAETGAATQRNRHRLCITAWTSRSNGKVRSAFPDDRLDRSLRSSCVRNLCLAGQAMKSDWVALVAVFCIVFMVMLWMWVISGGVV